MTRMSPEKMAKVSPGDVDLLSKAAHSAGVPICPAVNAKTISSCSRAVGHDENRPGHPASTHVTVDRKFVAQEVWR